MVLHSYWSRNKRPYLQAVFQFVVYPPVAASVGRRLPYEKLIVDRAQTFGTMACELYRGWGRTIHLWELNLVEHAAGMYGYSCIGAYLLELTVLPKLCQSVTQSYIESRWLISDTLLWAKRPLASLSAMRSDLRASTYDSMCISN